MSPPAWVLAVRRPLLRPPVDAGGLRRVMRAWQMRRVLALGAILVAVSMLHVWLRLQVVRLGYELSAARQMQLRLEHERRELEVELATLRDPGRIDSVARGRLGMTDPRPGQVATLP